MQEFVIATDGYTAAGTSDLILVKYAFAFSCVASPPVTPKRPQPNLHLLRVPHLDLQTTKRGSVVDQLMLLSSC